MNPLDRAIATVAPVWAVRREHARMVLDQVQDLRKRSYDAAQGGRRTENWYAPGTGPNAENVVAARLRNRARDLVRNNPLAAGATRKLASKIVGSGIQARLEVGDDDNEKPYQQALDIWNRFADHSDSEGLVDFYAQQHTIARSFVENGEALVLYSIDPQANKKTDFPLKATVLEPDFLDSNKNQALPDGGAIIQGVEYDPRGRRRGYWLFNEHPGESFRVFTRASLASAFVPADEVDHVLDPLRAGQARGVSMFATIALSLRDIDETNDAEIMRRKIAACLAVFVKRNPTSIASPLTASTTQTSQQGSQQRIEQFGPGMVNYLAQDEDISSTSPPNADGFIETMRYMLQVAAVGIGMTYEQFTGDLSNTTYSGGRLGVIDFWPVLDHWQWHCFVPMLMRRTWDRVGRVAAITGERKIGDPWTPHFIMPQRLMLDPQKDGQAIKEGIRALTLNPIDAIESSTGDDIYSVMKSAKRLNGLFDKNNIISDSDARKVGLTSTPRSETVDPPPNPPTKL